MKRWLSFPWVLVAAISCRAASTISPTSPYAYGANIGWINALGDVTNGAVMGQHFCQGYVYGANVGWIDLGDGTPSNGLAYGNDTGGDFGVNHDGLGHLTGYAYGANIGWVNFEQTYGKPKVDLASGSLAGYAWSANVGWISLSGVATLTLDPGPDTDGDGIPDAWEYGHTNDLAVLTDGGNDSDGDGVPDVDEYGADTDPFDAGDYLVITQLTVDADTNLVTWTCVPTRRYTLRFANAVSNGVVWADAAPSVVPPSGPDLTMEVTGVQDTNRFYRVMAQPPLSP